MAVTRGKWRTRVETLLASFSPPLLAWREADRDTIRNVVVGTSPYSGSVKPEGAARVVFNISSAHIAAFVDGKSGAAYLNRYDVSASTRVGTKIPTTPGAPDIRDLIDQTLADLIEGVSKNKLYYGAVELNGSGIRYYGDVSLVLKIDSVDRNTTVLDRNSFDLICAPMRAKTLPGDRWSDDAAKAQADQIAGIWNDDLQDMAVFKTLDAGRTIQRRITVGTISEGILCDEDYMEVIRPGSFDVAHVAEARLAAPDAALDGRVADRLRRGPVPDWADLLWRHRRRKSDSALRGKGVRTRVVASSGRVRS